MLEKLAGIDDRFRSIEDDLAKSSDDFQRRAGTGGDEAGLFAANLFRMYSRYAEGRRWGMEVLSQNETGLGGLKEIIFLVKGKGAYSRLKYESGGHRRQRVPGPERRGRAHT